MMDQFGATGEAFGGGKAGGQQDPLVFLKKPNVVARLTALVIMEYYFLSNQYNFSQIKFGSCRNVI